MNAFDNSSTASSAESKPVHSPAGNTERPPAPNVSLAIPIHNEECGLAELLSRCRQVLDELPGGPHEIVLTDDGSTDRSLSILRREAESDSRLTVVSLSRNFGHQAALAASLAHTKGDVVLAMDGDLQDAPEELSRFLEKYREGFDVVYAIRTDRKESLLMRQCYGWFYRVIRWLADLDLPQGAGDFALLSRRVVDLIVASAERHRYLRGLRTWYGFRQCGIEVERQARYSGTPSYGFRQLFRLAFDGIFAFSTIPIRCATLLGLFTVGSSVLFAAYSAYARLFWEAEHQAPAGFTAIIFIMTFLGGAILLFLGIVGEYIGRIYNEVKRRPHFVVDQVFTQRDK